MTVAYLDASALVKLVVEEHGSEHVAMLWDGADAVFTSRLSSVEVRTALAAARRSDRLSAQAYARATTTWETYRAGLRIVELTPALEAAAGDLPARHALSGADAIHLASALVLVDAQVVVATWDARLLAASRAAGLATLPDGP